MIVLSRQGMPVIPSDRVSVSRGATVVRDGTQAVIIGTGSEVTFAVDAAELLDAEGISARVVSLSSWELFRELDDQQRAQVLPPSVPAVAIEAGATLGWLEFADAVVGLDRFGVSAPGDVAYQRLGVTADTVAERVRAW